MAATITPESAWSSKRRPNLETVVGQRMWPTPHANCHTGAGEHGTGGPNLQTMVKIWPTPVQSMHKGSSPASLTRKDGQDRSHDQLDHAVMTANGGQLNPQWVEWLMGWPLGWTVSSAWETAKSRSRRPSPGESSEVSE